MRADNRAPLARNDSEATLRVFCSPVHMDRSENVAHPCEDEIAASHVLEYRNERLAPSIHRLESRELRTMDTRPPAPSRRTDSAPSQQLMLDALARAEELCKLPPDRVLDGGASGFAGAFGKARDSIARIEKISSADLTVRINVRD